LFVTNKVASHQESVGTVPCPQCQVGWLHISQEDWDQFTASDATCYYLPQWHSFDTDGTLHVKASGFRGFSHWTGELAIDPAGPEYQLWRWLVAQKEYHRLVKESEVPAIREEWLRHARY
jgi:hypothetical protein